MSVRFEMRLPDELAERVDAARGLVPRAAWVKAALERALEPVSAVASPAEQRDRLVVSTAADEVMAPVRSPRFSCPTAGCGFSAGSLSAVCPSHGRRVR